MASIASVIAQGTDATKGMNLVIPALAAGIVALGVASRGSAFSLAALSAALSAHPIALAITAFVGFAAVLTGAGAIFDSQVKDIDESLDKTRGLLNEVAESQDRWNRKISNIES